MYNSLEEAKEAINMCNKCTLCQNKKKSFFANGNDLSDVMFITDYPRDEEESSQDLWLGKAGKLIQQALIGHGINKEKIYFTSLVKCNCGGKEPQKTEIGACLDYLRSQVVLVKPKIVLLMGNVVIKEILGEEKTLSNLRGQVVDKKGIKYIPTCNVLSLFMDESKKIDFWNDLELLKEEANKLNIDIK